VSIVVCHHLKIHLVNPDVGSACTRSSHRSILPVLEAAGMMYHPLV